MTVRLDRWFIIRRIYVLAFAVAGAAAAAFFIK